MSFVTSGQEDSPPLKAVPHDVVISDRRMPGMDGAVLLELVRDRCPGAVRTVLSGQADMRMVGRTTGAAHRLTYGPTAASAEVVSWLVS